MKLVRRAIPAIAFGSLLFVSTAAPADVWASPVKQSNAGDSISQGFSANSWPGDHPQYSWVQGTDSSVDSTATRLAGVQSGFTQEPQSVTGAEMVGGNDSFPAQASRICAESVKPTRVRVLLGGNDICNRAKSDTDDATANLYPVETYVSALRAGLDQLAQCLPPKSVVQVMSMPRVDGLYQAGHDKSWWCYDSIWPLAGVCRIVTSEDDAGRRAQIGARVDQYNDAIAAEMTAYTSNANGKNPNGLDFITDWVGSISTGHANTSVGTFSFTADDINGTDCFHPNEGGQARIACVAWAKSPEGAGANASSCFAR